MKNPPKQLTVSASFKKMSSFVDGGAKFNKITNSIVYMICRDCQAFNIVENEGFKELLKVVAPLYKVPCANTIKRHILTKYDAISKLYKEKLSNIPFCSLTTDVWTDTMQTRSFLGITVHFAEGKTLQSATLGVYDLEERHTGEYIAEKLKTVCQEWGIANEKVTAIITDNGANVVKASEIVFGKKRHIPCFAHTLNLVAEKGIESSGNLVELIAKVKTIVTWFKQSVVASDELRKSNSSLKLIQEVPTRWNSKFYMIERFLELRPYVNDILNRHITAPSMLTALEVEQLQEVCHILRPIEAATREICGEKYVTCSLVIPMKNCLSKQLSKLSPKHNIGKDLRQGLLKEIKKRLDLAEYVNILSVSTLLDPRFKKIHFHDPIACSKGIKILREEVKELVGNFTIDSAGADSADSDLSSKSSENFNLWSDHHKMVRETWASRQAKEEEEFPSESDSEVSLYLRAPPVGRLGDRPLEIWEELKATHPNIFKIATKYFVTVATSVPSERLFSKAGVTLSQQRNRLKGKMLSKLLFLQSLEKEYFL